MDVSVALMHRTSLTPIAGANNDQQLLCNSRKYVGSSNIKSHFLMLLPDGVFTPFPCRMKLTSICRPLLILAHNMHLLDYQIPICVHYCINFFQSKWIQWAIYNPSNALRPPQFFCSDWRTLLTTSKISSQACLLILPQPTLPHIELPQNGRDLLESLANSPAKWPL